MPEEYFKKCGYKYDQVEPTAITGNQLHKLVKMQNQDMWDGPDHAATRAKRFNEALDVRSVERSINGHSSVKSL